MTESDESRSRQAEDSSCVFCLPISLHFISLIVQFVEEFMFPDPDQGQRDGVRQRDHVLQGEERHSRRGQRGRLRRVCEAAGRHHAEERAGNHDSRRNSFY